MNDLISRSVVIELLQKNMTSDIQDQIITENNINLIMSIPTAYDIDKVVDKSLDPTAETRKRCNVCGHIFCYNNADIVPAYESRHEND
jgi:hypothetical protein